MKKLMLLGATGSIGTQTIDVVTAHPELFELVGLSVGKNIDLLKEILTKVSVKYVCTMERQDELEKEYPDITFLVGNGGIIELAKIKGYDLLVNALVGFVGLAPTLEAMKHGHDVALANKETLVVAGKYINQAKHEYGVELFPIDSEHSAIFQALRGNEIKEVRRLLITASGGSFRELTRQDLENVTLEDALRHPNWAMGAKITIDSATMMNKGLEVIEAHWLFDVDYDDIEVVLHKQSLVHSMVEYQDYSIMAQLGNADMRIPIQYALYYPRRIPVENSEPLDFTKTINMTFEPMDMERFPLLKLAFEVGKKDGNLPAIMNAANEQSNQAFRDGKISFLQIEELVFKAVEAAYYIEDASLEQLVEADSWAREYVDSLIENM